MGFPKSPESMVASTHNTNANPCQHTPCNRTIKPNIATSIHNILEGVKKFLRGDILPFGDLTFVRELSKTVHKKNVSADATEVSPEGG